MSLLEKTCEELEARRVETLSRIGKVADHVLSRVAPIMIGGTLYPWPSNGVGKQLIVRREESVLVVTDGLSNPWDPSMHPSPPPWTFGFEAALEVPLGVHGTESDEQLSRSWISTLLWAATDWLVAEQVDLKGRLLKHGCVTHAVPPVAGLEHLVGNNGYLGMLVGVPYVGDLLETQVVLAPEPTNPRDSIWLMPLKLLTRDEYEWAIGVPDGSRATQLAKTFLVHGRHWSWPNRPSVLARARAVP